jgi:choline dehydrogenase-like flavoprotein
MNSKTGADVVIAGTGIVGCLIEEQMLNAGLSVLMLEAGPDIDRGRIVENYHNMPLSTKFLLPDGPFPPVPRALQLLPITIGGSKLACWCTMMVDTLIGRSNPREPEAFND